MPGGINDRFKQNIPFFDGGKNSKFSPSIIEVNEAADTKNCTSVEHGGAQTRFGAAEVATMPTGSWKGLTTFQPATGASQMLGWYDTDMVILSSNTFTTIPSSTSLFSDGGKVAHVAYDDFLFMSDGGTPYKYNGDPVAGFTRMGIEIPSAIGTIATAATAGSLESGLYMYKVAWVNTAGIGGDLSTAITLAVTDAAAVSMISIPTAIKSFGVEQRFLYRTVVDGSTYFFLSAIVDNATTVFCDIAPDADLVTPAPLDQGKPDNFKRIVEHKDRLWTVDDTDPSIIAYSPIGEPYLFPVLNFERMGQGDGKILSLGVHSDGVLAIKNSDKAILLFPADNDPINFLQIRINTEKGTTSNLFVNFENKMMYMGTLNSKPNGFIVLEAIDPVNEGISTDVGTTVAENSSDRIEPDIFSITQSGMLDMEGITWDNKLWITTSVDNSTTNNRIFQFDYFRRTLPKSIGAWWVFTGLNISFFTIFEGKLHGSTSGALTNKVLELDVEDSFSDDGVAIDSFFTTKFYGGDIKQEQNHKDFRELYLWIDLLGDFEMEIKTILDFDNGSGDTTTVNLNPGGSLWNTMIYGQDLWGGGFSEREQVIDLGKANGRRAQFNITNQATLNQGFKINRASLEYVLRPRRRSNN